MEEIVEIKNLIVSWGFDVEVNSENDIFIPAENFVISFCKFKDYHKKVGDKHRRYYLDKSNKCFVKGNKLIVIFEDEYVNKKQIVVSRLRNLLNINNGRKIYARKCIIHELDSKTAAVFCNTHHIQGAGQGGKVKLGAFKDDGFLSYDLVSVLVLGGLSRAKGNKVIKKDSWELVRFCSDSDYRVIGIASKLLKHFERNYDWEFLLSFADRRWSPTVSLYTQLGFDLESETQPNYFYIMLPEIRRVHRFACRRDVLRDRARSETTLSEEKILTMSELDLARYFGFSRVFDIGNYKFVKYNADVAV